MSDDVTVGEVARRLETFEKHTAEALDAISEQIKQLNFVSQGVYDANRAADKQQIDDLKADIAEIKESRANRARSIIDGLVYPALLLIIGALVAGKMYLGG